MKSNQIEIEINKLVAEVFEFTVNPKNTHLWIDSIIEESVNSTWIGLGAIYTQIIDLGNGELGHSESVVTAFAENELIEFTFTDTTYKCRYTYNETSSGTLLIYYEEDSGGLAQPMEESTLQKLKDYLESN